MSSKVVAGLLALALASGCASWKPDGMIAGTIPVAALEQPINAAGGMYGAPGVGTALVKIDQAAVARIAAKATQFPLIGVTTNWVDADGKDVRPPFTRIETPEYGPRKTDIPGDPVPTKATVNLDPALIMQALGMVQAQAAKPTSEGIPAASVPATESANVIDTNQLSAAEIEALRALGVPLP